MKFFSLLFIVACTSLPMNDRIAILSGKEHTPSASQVALAENELKVFLAKNHPRLARKYGSYFRQYFTEKKLLKAQFLCQVDGDEWKKTRIFVLDGGDCYFQFNFDPTKKELSEFSINGEA